MPSGPDGHAGPGGAAAAAAVVYRLTGTVLGELYYDYDQTVRGRGVSSSRVRPGGGDTQGCGGGGGGESPVRTGTPVHYEQTVVGTHPVVAALL